MAHSTAAAVVTGTERSRKWAASALSCRPASGGAAPAVQQSARHTPYSQAPRLPGASADAVTFCSSLVCTRLAPCWARRFDRPPNAGLSEASGHTRPDTCTAARSMSGLAPRPGASERHLAALRMRLVAPRRRLAALRKRHAATARRNSGGSARRSRRRWCNADKSWSYRACRTVLGHTVCLIRLVWQSTEAACRKWLNAFACCTFWRWTAAESVASNTDLILTPSTRVTSCC